MLLNSSTRSAKLQYSQHEYWGEVALRVDENGTCTRREWHFGWAKVALAHPKTTFLWFSRRTARAKMRCLLCFFLQNGCSGRGCLNNICIASYGVGAKFFTTNLMSVKLPQNTPKTRKPIAERTSHGCHGTHRTFLQRKDSHGWHGSTQIVRCAVLPQNSQNLAAWVWQGCHTLLICEHPCSSVGDSSLPEGSVCAFCGNIFSPTDFTDLHRCLECAVLQQNTEFGSVGMAGMPYPPNL